MKHVLRFSRRAVLRSATATGLLAAVSPSTRAEDPPAPRPDDVASIDAILAALYDVISGPKGQPRDWDRFRSLCAPSARLMVCVPNRDAPPKTILRVFSVDEFVAQGKLSAERQAFFEREVARKVDRFGHIAQVFSTYVARAEAAETAPPIAQGINSIQLFWDDARWQVVSILWDTEAPDRPIPPEYRPRGR